jgi:hypothetical protein
VDYPWDSFFLGWWSPLFSLEWWGLIRYGVYGSPAICRWKKSIIYRTLGRNRRPAVPRVFYPDTLPLSVANLQKLRITQKVIKSYYVINFQVLNLIGNPYQTKEK